MRCLNETFFFLVIFASESDYGDIMSGSGKKENVLENRDSRKEPPLKIQDSANQKDKI